MSKKKWDNPELVVLVKSKRQESVLVTRKRSSSTEGYAPDAIGNGCGGYIG